MPRVEGTETVALDRLQVWRLLNDPDTLAASIPGCRGFERYGGAEHRYRTAIAVAVGPVTGVYEGTVEYVDIAEPERCTIVVSGKGDKGTIDGRGAITLADRGDSTDVGYTGEFKLTGPVAGVGQRMAPGVSRKLIVETLHNLERRGTEQEDGGATAAQPSATATPQTRPRRPAAPEPFRPVSFSPALAFAAGAAVGLAVGFVIGVLV